MTVSLHHISGGKKKGKTQDKETPTTRQSLLLYTTPLFTLHSKSLHVPSNQFTARHFIMSAKQKTKQKKTKQDFLQVSSPFHIHKRGQGKVKVEAGYIHETDSPQPSGLQMSCTVWDSQRQASVTALRTQDFRKIEKFKKSYFLFLICSIICLFCNCHRKPVNKKTTKDGKKLNTLHLESVIVERFVYSFLRNSLGLTSIFSFGNRKFKTASRDRVCSDST